ncbi:MAG: glycosyltransferase family 2 protein [Bacteroidota bacterium]
MNKLSVIIVNYKGWNALEECLDSLEDIHSEEISLEVIVVDNCSNDGNFFVFQKKFHQFTFILNSGNNGFANGCNVGAANATSDYYLFLNPDTKVTQNDLEIYFKSYIEHQEIALMSCLQVDEKGKYYKQHNLLPKVITFFGLPRAIYKKLFKNKIDQTFNSNNEFLYPEWVTGAVVLISKDWFNKVKGWNEDFWMYMEDVDLCKKVSDNGGKIAVLKTATIFHKHGGASRINVTTKALTKTEVLISKHVYISNNFSKTTAFFLHFRLISGVILEKLLLSIVSIPLFFIKKLQVNRLIFKNYLWYLKSVISNHTFISPRSVNFNKNSK